MGAGVRPRLLDAFCGAGGAGEGYARSGFDVTGIDNRPMPRNPHTFIQVDALEYIAAHGHEYDVIHASPPCQAHSAMKTMPNAKDHADLIPETRELLRATGLPYVIENVVGAPLVNPITLCGTMFGLGTGDAELRRHRLFELHGFEVLLTPPCNHGGRGRERRVIGVYGGHGRDRRRRPATVGVWGNAGGMSKRGGVLQFSTDERREAMGIDWMNGMELSQAIPPAYTEFIGRQLYAAVMLADAT